MQKSFVLVLLCIAFTGATQAQKGAVSIAAGPLISIPVAFREARVYTNLKPGAGIVAIGQYNVSDKSALLLQMGLAVYGNKYYFNYYGQRRISIFSLQGGYKYHLGSRGYFINGLAGFDSYSNYGSAICFGLGAGKQFIIKEAYFINGGVDYMFGDTDPRFNFKAAFSLCRKPKIQ
jgi:hypothetical protein